MSGSGRKACRMSETGQKAIPNVRELVGRPSRMSGSGREALTNVRELSGGHPDVRELVGRPSRMSGSCQEAFRMTGSGWRPSRLFGSGR